MYSDQKGKLFAPGDRCSTCSKGANPLHVRINFLPSKSQCLLVKGLTDNRAEHLERLNRSAILSRQVPALINAIEFRRKADQPSQCIDGG